MNIEEEVKRLKREVEDLKKWKEQRTRQQITFPLDKKSEEILASKFITLDKEIEFTQSDGEVISQQFNLKLGTREIPVSSGLYLVPYAPDVANNTIKFSRLVVSNNAQVNFFSTEVVPGGLAAGPYYVINTTATTFQVSATLGGAAIDITSAGTGDHYYYFVAD